MKRVSSINRVFNLKFWILARESRGLTQKELAHALSVDQGWLSRAESGLREISPIILEQAASILDYPIEFFYQEDIIYGLGPTNLFNRKRQSVPVKVIQKIQAQINIKRLQISKLLRSIDLNSSNIPVYNIDEFNGLPQDIANTLRAYWKVPTGPIDNLVDLIEDNGGIVIEFDFQTSQIDAMSIVFPETPPLFFINPLAPKSRLRFTLCHELGHIVMHQHSLNPEIENQADQFASEFLLPSREIKPYLINELSISMLLDLKRYWKTSMQSILVKAKQLNTITDTKYTALWRELSRCGYRKNEPNEEYIPEEKPSLLSEIIETFQHEFKFSVEEFGTLLCLNESEVKSNYYKKRIGLQLVK